MIKTYLYLVILGETDVSGFQEEEKLLKSLGEVEKLTERAYGLVIKSSTTPDRQELRRIISDDGKYVSIVVRITANTKFSWCLYKPQSDYLANVYERLINESQEGNE